MIVPMLCHGWMAATSYRSLSAADQKPESTIPDDQKKALPTSTKPGARPPSQKRKKTEKEEEDEEDEEEEEEEKPKAAETTTVYDPYQAYYANYYGGYGGYPGYGYGGYPGYSYGYGQGSWCSITNVQSRNSQ